MLSTSMNVNYYFAIDREINGKYNIKQMLQNKCFRKEQDMPPKAKFTKEEIIEAALTIVREEGFDALTARALGAKLGSSARPIFTIFQSMEEVCREVKKAARDLYDGYVAEALSEDRPYQQRFKSVGAQYIRFAMMEPKLFQLLFMREVKSQPDFEGILPLIDHNYERILASVRDEYGLDEASAQRFYQHLWVYSHGIASLCATGMCRFTGEEIGTMMTEVFLSLLQREKTQ